MPIRIPDPDHRPRPVDHAPTATEAWQLAEEYVLLLDALGLEGWAVGVEPDPVPGADGRHGFTVYCKLKPGFQVPEQPQPLLDDDEYRELGGES